MMKRFKSPLLAPIVSALTMLAVTLPASAAGVSFGVLVPLTGNNAVLGQDILHGVQLAIDRVNQGYQVPMKGGKTMQVGPGVLDGKIKLITQDNESRPQSAMDSVRKLVNVNQVPVVVGVLTSAVSVATGQFTNGAKTVEIVSGATSPKLRDIGPYFFDSLGLDTLMGKALANFAMQDSGAKTYGSIATNDPFGVGMELTTCKRLQQLGGKCVSKVRYQHDKSDYRPEIRAVFQSHPQAGLFTAYGTEASLILRQAYQMGVNPAKGWYADYITLWSSEVSDTPQIAEGIKGLVPGKTTDFYQKQYADGYQKKFGTPPKTAFGAYAYDGAMLAALAVKKAGSDDPDAIRQALHQVSQNYVGVTGDKRFDKDGMQQSEQYSKKIYQDGKLRDYPLNEQASQQE